MGRKMIKTQYYIEFVLEDDDEPYILQSAAFDTKKEAEDWYKNGIDYTADYISVYLMAMKYTSEDDYDIDMVKQLV